MGRTVRRLDVKLHREFQALVRDGLKQYRLSKADLADQAKPHRTKSDLLYERAGVQKRGAGDVLVGKSPEQVRRFVENALSRPPSAESARVVIWRIVNCKKACAWRKDAPDGTDPWLTKMLALSRTSAPYVRDRPAVSSDAPISAFVHPKGVPEFVRQTLDDAASWLPVRKRAALEKAMIRSIEKRAKGRARALETWVWQSEAFIDVRVYEGPMHDPVSGADVAVRETRYCRVSPFDSRSPLDTLERKPEAHERLQAIIADTFDGSGLPGSIGAFVLPPMRAIAVDKNEIFVESDTVRPTV